MAFREVKNAENFSDEKKVRASSSGHYYKSMNPSDSDGKNDLRSKLFRRIE